MSEYFKGKVIQGIPNTGRCEMEEKITLVLLPGLHGTARLFQPLRACMSNQFDVLSVSYPGRSLRSYDQLTEYINECIRGIKTPYILLGESFSGPLALMVAQAQPVGLIGVILVATFVTPPSFTIGRFLPWTLGFHLAKPLYALRQFLSRTSHKSLIKAISTELQKTEPRVLAHRIQAVFRVDAVPALISCKLPIVYFRGTRDLIVGKRNLERILLHKPDIEVKYFPTQHFLLQSCPELAWKEIVQFIHKCLAKRQW